MKNILRKLVVLSLVIMGFATQAQEIPPLIFKYCSVSGAADAFLNGTYAQAYIGRWTNGVGGDIWHSGGTSGFWFFGDDSADQYWVGPWGGGTTNYPFIGVYAADELGSGAAITNNIGAGPMPASPLGIPIQTNIPTAISVNYTSQPVVQIFEYNTTTNVSSITYQLQINSYSNDVCYLESTTNLASGSWNLVTMVTNRQIYQVDQSQAQLCFRLLRLDTRYLVNFHANYNSGIPCEAVLVQPEPFITNNAWYCVTNIDPGQIYAFNSNDLITAIYDDSITNSLFTWPFATIYTFKRNTNGAPVGYTSLTNNVWVDAHSKHTTFDINQILINNLPDPTF